jgi:putative lipoic acid-binding regulatory protein
MNSESGQSLLEFPCRFPIKAMGRNDGAFEGLVNGIIAAHAKLWPGEEIRSTASKTGVYVSITAVIEATSQQQLDAIYQQLTDCEQVLMAL